ncbi:response regulator transcription factor [Rehaibacterium terrae]|jgi:DNA-binding NarL/FixJ family response regulator|uniref:DNA-binding NarL/FixJ family response regulator n=1 Tax=Rehaibacterium terrae TaxID=1341696 RepID=A0A7W7Y238_9GAMM|nr:response regulator transcription factor [Rehaibacterium terrae]MBB5016585.1 DNA-binding NarL/FixJ family response regulator [Rehaibacterium terrae]
MPRLLIADDHPLYRLALVQAVRGVIDGADVAEAGSLEQARATLAAQPDTDLVLLDLHLPDSHGLMGLAALRGEFPSVAVVMISAHDDPATIRRALAYGAAGFIPKRAGMDELQAALRAVLDCEEWLPPALRADIEALPGSREDADLSARLATLTPQQFKVLSRVAEGRLNKQIADELGIQERTVKAHMSAIFEKLGVRNRTQAGVLLRSLELADPSRSVAKD